MTDLDSIHKSIETQVEEPSDAYSDTQRLSVPLPLASVSDTGALLESIL